MNYAVTSLGCRTNSADKQYLEGVLRRAGHAPAERPETHVVLACSVTARAERRTRRACTRALSRLADGGGLVVAGCARRETVEEVARARGDASVRRFAGTAEELAVALDAGGGFAAERNGRAAAFLKVQEGCDKRCSYCIVPHLRGRARSLPLATVVERATTLRDAEELVLAGTDVGSWGGRRLPRLLSALHEELPRARVRLSSIDPSALSDDLADAVARGYVLPHLHLGLQSGSEAVLRHMRRPTRTNRLVSFVADLRAEVPALGLGLDVMVGYPTETDDDFRLTCELIASLRPSYLHVFRYSPRRGTAAWPLGNPMGLKAKARFAHLAAVDARVREGFLRTLAKHPQSAILTRGGRVVTASYARTDVATWNRLSALSLRG